MRKIKIIKQGREARRLLKEGIDLVADVIKTTLGPKGRNVIVERLGPLPPRSMNDGYYIADHIEHKDPVINAGVAMLKEVCKKTNDVAGDETTSTAILAQVLIDRELREVEKGKNPIDIKLALERDLEKLLQELSRLSQPVADSNDIRRVATIAGNNDESIGDALAEIYEKVGKNASILVEKSNESAIRVEAIKGIYFNKGFGDARVFVNNSARMTAEHRDIKILIVDEKVEYADDIVPFLEKLNPDRGTRLLVIANEMPISLDAMNILGHNNALALRGERDKEGNDLGFFCVGVEAPEFGPTRAEILEDLAVATGGICVSKQNGLTLKDADPKKVLGRAEKVIVTSNTTTIIGGNANQARLERQIEMIKGEMAQLHVNAKITREKYEGRLQVISAGVGIIHAGGATEMENKERHLRLEDAVLAARAAGEEGISAGGGFTYWRLAKLAKTALREACLAIPEQVAENAGKNSTVILQEMENTNLGYNALTDKFEDLKETGVLDSTKVIRVALQNAVSLTGLFLTTSAAVIEAEESEAQV